jgi:pyridoxine/pyridoxamine 5'-phosphate oxidase
MPSYRVCFINEIPRNEKLFRCCQRSIVIRSARTPARAVEAAKKRFAKLEGIRDWKIHAALIEIEPTDIEAKPERPARLHGRTCISRKRWALPQEHV